MANEARVQASLYIKNPTTALEYQSRPSSFVADVNASNGPTPGAVLVTVPGVDIDLSKLTAGGGLCRLMNLDPTNFVTWGLYNATTTRFLPLGEMLPGESYIVRLSRYILEDFVGTGTAVGEAVTLHMKANTASCRVLVEAFDP